MEKIKKILIYSFLVLLGLTFANKLLNNNVILSLLYVSIVFFVGYKIKIPKFGLLLFVVSFLLRLIVVLELNTPIVSDPEVTYTMAKNVISGNFVAIAHHPYIQKWGFRMGYALFMSLLLLICKGTFLIKLVNCLFSSLIVLFIYLISRELTNERSARIVSVSYMLFPFPLLFNSVLSDQHISSFLFLLAIYIFVSKKTSNMNHILKYFLIGLTLAFGNIIRPEAIIFYVSIILSLFLTNKLKDYKKVIINILIMLVTYFSITMSASYIVIYSGVNPTGLKNMIPSFKVAMGFNYESGGDYEQKFAEKFIGYYTEKSTSKSSDENYVWADNKTRKKLLLDNTIGQIEKWPSLFIYKARMYWLNTNRDTKVWIQDFAIGHLKNKTIKIFGYKVSGDKVMQLIYSINQLYLYIFFILMGCSIYLHRNNMSNEQFIIFIILGVTTGAYLLIECTPRYAYIGQIYMFIMSAYSVKCFLEKFKTNCKSLSACVKK